MNHTQLLNYLISKHNLKSYLEIGVRSTEQNFDKIRCPIKYGIDPALKFYAHPVKDYFIIDQDTDTWFKNRLDHKNKEELQMFDLIFIDGLHHADQVERDFNNSLRCLNDNGFIVIHDCLPVDEITTKVPRQTKVWHGDVYKFCMKLNKYNGIGFITLNMDEGCCLVWKEPGLKSVDWVRDPISWDTYKKMGRVIMNVIEPEVFFHGTPV